MHILPNEMMNFPNSVLSRAHSALLPYICVSRSLLNTRSPSSRAPTTAAASVGAGPMVPWAESAAGVALFRVKDEELGSERVSPDEIMGGACSSSDLTVSIKTDVFPVSIM